jgi:ribosomal protein L37AE/L43A
MDSPLEPTASPTQNVICPGCAEEVEVDRAPGQMFRCPYCNMTFMIDGEADTTDGAPVNDDEESQADRLEMERRRHEELDSLRIRQLSVLRRAEYRQRSYVVTGLAACGIAVGQSIWMARDSLARYGWRPRAFGYAVVILIAVLLAAWLWRQLKILNARIAEHHTTDTAPEREPDFSTLSDGQDRWKRLNDVR